MDRYYKDKLTIGLIHKTENKTTFYGLEYGKPEILVEDPYFLDCLISDRSFEEISEEVFHEKLKLFMEYFHFHTEVNNSIQIKLKELKSNFG